MDDDIVRATLGGFELALAPGGEPPTEFRLFETGTNATTKGPILFDEKAAKSVMKEYHARGRKRIAGDWEHASIAASDDPTKVAKGGVPASMWFTPQVRQGASGPELWAVDVKFTPEAFKQVASSEIAHYSPAVLFEKSTGRVVRLINVALTNEPATIGQEQLIAASGDKTTIGDMLMSKHSDHMKTLRGSVASSPEMSMCKLCRTLVDGMEPDEDDGVGETSQEKRAMTEEKGQDDTVASLLAISGKATTEEAVATFTAWKDSAAKVETLSAELAQLRTEKTKGEVAALLDKARADGKLTPAVLSDSRLVEPQTDTGRYIKSLSDAGNVLALGAFVGALPRLVGEPHKAPDVDPSTILVLTDDERKRGTMLGLTESQMLKAKKDRLEAAANR